jgi:phospholipid/cholesterol/gamma-HCH transport system ATP-binding protein
MPEDKKNNVVLKLEHLAKSFGSLQVLKNINIDVKKGETIVVLGKSGTGKSVILKCIIGLITPDSGNIYAFNENVLKLNYSQMKVLRKKLGFLFQSGALYDSMTVRQNLEFPLDRHPEMKKIDHAKKIKEVLESVGLYEAIDKMPSELSGGMKKRIALARTLVLEPDMILYDEPTTGLDPVTSHEISLLIRKMQKDYEVTTIVVTHDIACARLVADRIVVLKDGEFFMEGTFDELSKSEDDFVRGFFEFE